MMLIETTKDIYSAVEELIQRLSSHPKSKLPVILDHRMHKVAWTTGDELLEELQKVLASELANQSVQFDPKVRMQNERLLVVINQQVSGK